jgi:hypothetical protein
MNNNNTKNIKKLLLVVLDYDFNKYNVQLINLARKFIETGTTHVDIIVDSNRVGVDYTELSIELKDSSFEVHDIASSFGKVRSFINKQDNNIHFHSVISKVYYRLYYHISELRIRAIIEKVAPDVVVLVERLALGVFPTKKFGSSAKVYYSSMEIYGDDHPHMNATQKNVNRWKNYFLRKKINLVDYLIIQDSSRDHLFRKNFNFTGKSLYLPISVLGNHDRAQSDFLHRYLDLKPGTKILLQYGSISDKRLTDKLLENIHQLPDDMVVVLHGLSGAYFRRRYRSQIGKKIFFTDFLVPNRLIHLIIKSADIGICTYTDDNDNDILTLFSSDKMARFMQFGVPVIVSKHTEAFSQFVTENNIGVSTDKFADLGIGVDIILKNRDKMSERSNDIFESYYNYSNNFVKIFNQQ